MADILLSVGAQLGKLETSKFQKDIEDAVSKLNGGKPPVIKVKMEVDPASISDFNRQIESIVKTANGNGNIIDALGLSGLSGVANDLRAATDALKSFKKESSNAGKSSQDSAKQIDAFYTKIYGKIEQLDKLRDKLERGGNTNSGFVSSITDSIAALNKVLADYDSGKLKSLQEASAEYQKILRNIAKTKMDAQLSGAFDNTGLSALESRLIYMVSLSNIVLMGIRKIKQAVSTAIELDTAMTQLRIVTNATDSEFTRYGQNIAVTAKQIGASMTDLIDSTTVFARLGYSLSESQGLAKFTAMLSNVGAIDVSSAQSALTAITKAYGISADEIETVMDKMIVVGNNFPISVAELAEGMNNAGSALAAAGNSFEQSIALLTASNTTVQNISKASTGLRTITARIRGTRMELDDLGESIETAKYEEALDILTKHKVALTENGEYRTTYDILKNIADVWSELTSMEQASIAEQLAGKMLLLPEHTEMCA